MFAKVFKILMSLFLIFLFSCAQQKTSVIKIEKLEPVAGLGKAEYLELKRLYLKNLYGDYLRESYKFLQKYAASEYSADVLTKRGIIYLGRNDYKDASYELMKSRVSFPGSSSYDLASYYYSISEFKRGDDNLSLEAIKTIDFEKTNLEKELILRARWLKAHILARKREYSDAIECLVKLYNQTEDNSIRSKVSITITSYLNDMDMGSIEDAASRYSDTPWAPYFLFEEGERNLNKGDNGSARSAFRKLLSDFPDHEYTTQARAYLHTLESLDQVEPYTIGVVLPLTGRFSAFGQKSLRGIQLAAGIFDNELETKGIPIKLAIMDSQSDADIAKIAVDRLIAEDHVISVIGSLRSNTADVVAQQCSLAGIPNISLSQKEDLTENKNSVFRISMTNKSQIKRLVRYAINQLEMKNFAILFPEDYYGSKLMTYFWDEVLNLGGNIVAVESYETKQADFRDQVQKLLGIYFNEPRKTEFNELKELKVAELGRKVRNQEVKLPAIVKFDALFVPDDAKVVAQIAPYLAFYDVENVVLMGPNTWHSDILIKRGREHVNGAFFVDGFYEYSKDKEVEDFVSEFKKVFNASPGVLEAQSYDAARIIIQSLSKIYQSSGEGSLTRDNLTKALYNVDNYHGATGTIKFNSDGESDKNLFVLGVDKWKIVQRD